MEWDGATWAERTEVVGPPARYWHGMETLASKLVLFGGSTMSALYNAETWEWDGTAWTQRTPVTSPSPRGAQMMATVGSEVVLFGGYDGVAPGSGMLGDTWSWDGTTWTKRAVRSRRPARTSPPLAG